MEPYKKRRWRRAACPDPIRFFTCARPGRSRGADSKVPDKTIDLWVRNLPGPNTAIVSLLGAKPDGMSEYSFYSFHGRTTFQEWLNGRYGDGVFVVVEHPTTDYRKVSESELVAIAADIECLLSEGRTVVLVDSGGETRSGQVCRHMGFVEDARAL